MRLIVYGSGELHLGDDTELLTEALPEVTRCIEAGEREGMVESVNFRVVDDGQDEEEVDAQEAREVGTYGRYCCLCGHDCGPKATFEEVIAHRECTHRSQNGQLVSPRFCTVCGGAAHSPKQPHTRATFPPIIYWQPDLHNSGSGIWVKISPFDAGVTVAIYHDQPNAKSQASEAMASVDVFPDLANQAHVVVWDQDTNPDSENGYTVALISDVAGWHRPDESR